MNLQEYEALTEALTHNLERDARVLGLMAAGSMARQSHQPDEWSDHDFWVVVEPDAVAWFRTRREWLPYNDQIALWFIDTLHGGITAIYNNGHLLEFAVSDRKGLLQAKVNDYRLLIDRIGLAADVAQLQSATTSECDTVIQDSLCLLGRFLTDLLIGVGRYRRGEHLSARQLITGSSLQALVRLIAKHVPPEHAIALDNLDPLRRFEMAYPEIAADIDALLRVDLDQTAVGLTALADRLLRDRIVDYPTETVGVVCHHTSVSAN